MLSEPIMDAIRAALAAQAPGAGTHEIVFGARAVPCSIPAGIKPRAVLDPVKAVVAVLDGGPPEGRAADTTGADAKAADAQDGEGANTETDSAEGPVDFHLSGVASSTSVDWYGTEMSVACLTDMASQFKKGVEVFVGHGSFLSGLEWNNAIGITDDAEVREAKVANPAPDEEGPGALLEVAMHFQSDADTSDEIEDNIRQLRSRVRMGRPTGLSIGGWFRRIQYITDENGDLTRIIIDKVDLDHLATTRRPANPDSMGLAEMRSVFGDALKAARRAAPAAAVAPAARPTTPAELAPEARALDPITPGALGDATADLTSHRKGKADEDASDAKPACDMKSCDGDGCEDPECVCSCHDRAAPSASTPGPGQAPAAPSTLSEPSPAQPTPAVQADAPAPKADPSPPVARASQPENQETDMTPEQIQAMIDQAVARGRAEAQAEATKLLDESGQRAGLPAEPPKARVIEAPAGADLHRAKGVMDVILHNRSGYSPGSFDKGFKGELLRSVHFGTQEVDATMAPTYREPSGERQKGMWLGIAHQLRTQGLDELADIAERAAPILGIDIRGEHNIPGFRKSPEAVFAARTRIGDAAELLKEVIRSAANDGHPTFAEPGTRPAATRALTVSATSDKVTVSLVSGLLQQLSNIQLGARTQLRRVPGAGKNYVTPKRTVSSTLAEWVADGTAPTEDSGTWDNDTWNYRTLATKIKVTRQSIAQGAQWGDIVAAEALNKGEDFNYMEEKTIFQGDYANNLPNGSSTVFNGLLTLISANSGQTVANTTASGGDVLTLANLDTTITKVRGRENKANLRIFCSERGHVLLDTVLQAQQMFTNMTQVQAGFVVQTYQGIPVIESSGIPDAMTWNGATPRVLAWTGGATTAIVVVNLQNVYLVVLVPMTLEQVSSGTAQYSLFEMYTDEVLVLDNAKAAAILGGIKAT